MNSERSSSPIPKEEDVTKDKAIGDHKPQTFERPEHPVTSPISGQDPSIDTPFPGQTGSETTLSTPPTTAKPHPHGDAINDDLKRTEEADTTELEPVMSPGAKIDDFDWEDLEQRYLKAMEERGIQEQILLQEFEKLTQYFAVWAGTASSHESERSLIRLKTRISHVQNSEDQLEEKRVHYEKVVAAFQSALQLLNGP